MDTTKSRQDGVESEDVSTPQIRRDAEAENVPAWELIDAGRYRPRRIRGSCRGRELG